MIEVEHNEEFHRGHASYRANAKGSVTVLCPYGHLVDFVRPGEWATSSWSLNSSFGTDIVTCHGKLKDDAKPYPFKDTTLGAWATIKGE